ncbi:MAG: ACP S-malonyltransferase [Cryomorphaceae bacterium BACL21 MAG-121220-bin10]|jgi:[acyl-carrier-protein] S-malonyltransferase|nr:MAG: ACP S-malonyltransferase [Cryomorphaceae bacterium BACL21 MAG-121220-bin10]|tara:strand:- start:7007 stop:7891 length:885 start_codon:yes stop_codon:yes gene_type:complete
MTAYVFPGQGAQFPTMGQDLFEASSQARALFAQANSVLGFDITKIMFEGTPEDLKETRVTQPAVFLHSTILARVMGTQFRPDMVAGHSLGEFSALVASQAMAFDDGLRLVYQRAQAMQKACELEPSTMAAVLGLDDDLVARTCEETPGIVVAANYNCPGQLVISGTVEAVTLACERLKEAGARRALILPVGGAFHSPLMAPAQEQLAAAIEATRFNIPICPVYQNVTADAVLDPITIQKNLVTQLTAPVKWTQSIRAMVAHGANHFVEIGPGNVLQGLVKKIEPSVATSKGVLA